MLTTADAAASAATAIEFLPKHQGQHLESSPLLPETSSLKSVGGVALATEWFIRDNPGTQISNKNGTHKISSFL